MRAAARLLSFGQESAHHERERRHTPINQINGVPHVKRWQARIYRLAWGLDLHHLFGDQLSDDEVGDKLGSVKVCLLFIHQIDTGLPSRSEMKM